MLICVAGDVHGELMRFYDNVKSFSNEFQFKFDWVIQLGDFGVWPEVKKMDAASRRHGDMGAFSVWLKAKKAVPIRTLMIAGNHDDSEWLDGTVERTILPLDNLFYLPNGRCYSIDGKHRPLILGAVGGVYSPRDYKKKNSELQGRAHRHYVKEQVDALIARERIDILLTHEAPDNVCIGSGNYSHAEGLDEILAKKKPDVCFFGHHHRRVSDVIQGVRCEGLPKIGMQNHLLAVNIDENNHATIFGEWPTKRGHRA